jgi:DinB superfamily
MGRPGGPGRFTARAVGRAFAVYGLPMKLEDGSSGSGQAPLRHERGLWPGPFSPDDDGSNARDAWLRAFRTVRAETERRAAPLSPEDQVVQSMPDASPIKWHRAHTTWFFEQFVLTPHLPLYRAYDSRFAFLFNSR